MKPLRRVRFCWVSKYRFKFLLLIQIVLLHLGIASVVSCLHCQVVVFPAEVLFPYHAYTETVILNSVCSNFTIYVAVLVSSVLHPIQSISLRSLCELIVFFFSLSLFFFFFLIKV